MADVTNPDTSQDYALSPGLSSCGLARLCEAYDQRIRSVRRALYIWDHDTAGCSWRVTGHAVVLGLRLGIAMQAVEHLRWGAELYNIGKMAIPDHVLVKAGKFKAGEWELRKDAHHATRCKPRTDRAPLACHRGSAP